jgi:serine/threonine protein kinase
MLTGEDSRDLMASLKQLKARAQRPASRRLAESEIGGSFSTLVRLAISPAGALTAVKTPISPRGGVLIQREHKIHCILNHPLVIGFREFHAATRSSPPEIVTEFAGNGSLAGHLPVALREGQSGLRGPNRIARIIVGIILAMRYIHACGVVHRDLKPANVLLDWNWNVRIADFGHSTLRGALDPPSLVDPDRSVNLLSVDLHYLAPECYENQSGPKCDVFSFGLILYELLVGREAFPKKWPQLVVEKLLVVDEFRPDVPASVLPAVRELIADCWAQDPDDRPSFRGIFKRLKWMDFKVTAGVNPMKIAKFVKEVKEQAAVLKRGESSTDPTRPSRGSLQ